MIYAEPQPTGVLKTLFPSVDKDNKPIHVELKLLQKSIDTLGPEFFDANPWFEYYLQYFTTQPIK